MKWMKVMMLSKELIRPSISLKVRVTENSRKSETGFILELIDPEYDTTYTFFSPFLAVQTNGMDNIALFENLAHI